MGAACLPAAFLLPSPDTSGDESVRNQELVRLWKSGYNNGMTRQAELIICAISILLLIGAAGLWWRGIFPSSGDELVLVPDGQSQAWGGPGGGQDQAGDDESTVFNGPTGPGGTGAIDGGVSSQDGEDETEVIFVHIAGAVESPGVYKLRQGQRLYEALELAVPREDADLDYLNLAGMLYDQDKIYVPKKGEFADVQGAASGQGSLYGHWSPPYLDTGQAKSGSASKGPVFPINVNTATAKELEALPGIGPAKAAAIVEFRRLRGPFTRKEDLLKVSGIGEVTYSKIEPLITIK